MVLMVAPANEPLRPRGRRRRGADPIRTGLSATEPSANTDIATDLEARYPGWVILWRHWARRYWAFPAGLPNVPGPVEARNVQDLLTQMNDLEVQHSPRGGNAQPAHGK